MIRGRGFWFVVVSVAAVVGLVYLQASAQIAVPEAFVVGERQHGHRTDLVHRADLVRLTRALSAQAPQGGPAAPRSFRGLVSDVPQARDVQRVRQLRIATVGAEPDARSTAQPRMFALLEQRVVLGSLRRERFPQLSYDRLVVIVQDAAGRELDWRLVPNPGLMRAEAPGPDGRLRGGTIEVDSVELSIAIPDVAGADRVGIFRPRWTGTEYLLDPVGQVRLAP